MLIHKIHVTQFEEKPKLVGEHPSGTRLGGMPVKKLFEGRVFFLRNLIQKHQRA